MNHLSLCLSAFIPRILYASFNKEAVMITGIDEIIIILRVSTLPLLEHMIRNLRNYSNPLALEEKFDLVPGIGRHIPTGEGLVQGLDTARAHPELTKRTKHVSLNSPMSLMQRWILELNSIASLGEKSQLPLSSCISTVSLRWANLGTQRPGIAPFSWMILGISAMNIVI